MPRRRTTPAPVYRVERQRELHRQLEQARTLQQGTPRQVARIEDAKRHDRLAYIVAQRQQGTTLAAIGDVLGISRERVRQLLHRASVEDAKRAPCSTADPIAVMRILRDPTVTSFAEIARRTGTHPSAVSSVLRTLGVYPAAVRLCRWRVNAPARRHIVAKLRAWADLHGRAPTTVELNDPDEEALPYGMALINTFGSMPKAYAAAGLTTRPTGGPGHLIPKVRNTLTHCGHGHEFTPENTYVYKGYRQCRACLRERNRRYDREKRQRKKA